jgi:hypothetical protein
LQRVLLTVRMVRQRRAGRASRTGGDRGREAGGIADVKREAEGGSEVLRDEC